MASFTERLAFLISVKADEAIRDVKKFGATSDKELGKAESRMLKLSGAANNLSKTVALPVVAGLTAATVAASNLEQSLGGTEAVFGDASGAIDDYAKAAADGSGLSERAFREATTQIGGQLKRMTGDVDFAAKQSVELTKIGADLAATYGGTTAEAVDALSAAFRGEADPAERFNLNLKQGAVNAKAVEMGLAQSTSSVSENAKAMATLALVYEQSADAQGQFGREADSAAGSMQRAQASLENASAELGQSLAPIAANAADKVAFLARNFGELPSAAQTGVLALGGIAATIGPITSLVGRVGELRTKLTEAGTAGQFAGRAIGAIGKASVVVGTIFAVKAAIDALSKSTKDLSVDVDNLARQSDEELLSSWRALVDEANNVNPIKGQAEAAMFGQIARDNIGVAERLIVVLKQQGVETDFLERILERETAAQNRANAAAGAGVGDFSDLGAAIAGAADEAITYDKILDSTLGAHIALGDASDNLAATEDRVRDALRGTGEAASEATQDITTYQEALDDSLGALLDVDVAHESAADAVRGLAEALGQAGVGSEDSSDFMDRFYGRAKEGAEEAGQSVVEATAAAVRAAKDEVEAMAESGEIADTAEARKAALLDRLYDLKEQFPAVAGQIDKYIRSVSDLSGDLPTVETRTQRVTRANRDLEESARDLVDAAEDQIDALVESGEVADTAGAKHMALRDLLEELKVKFPELATIIDTYITDVNKAWEDYLRNSGHATAGAVRPPSGGLGEDRYNSASAPTVNVTQHIYGDGLNAGEVADLAAERTKRALVGSRVG